MRSYHASTCSTVMFVRMQHCHRRILKNQANVIRTCKNLVKHIIWACRGFGRRAIASLLGLGVGGWYGVGAYDLAVQCMMILVVAIERGPLTEGLAAFVTRIGALSRVNDHVPLQLHTCESGPVLATIASTLLMLSNSLGHWRHGTCNF